MNILLVDDRTIADDFATVLNHHGYRALPVYSTREAIEHTKMMHFDLALLGVVMPGRYTLEAAIEIRMFSPECKVVLWVEDVPLELLERARLWGHQFEHIRLPLPYEEFLGAIESFSKDLPAPIKGEEADV